MSNAAHLAEKSTLFTSSYNSDKSKRKTRHPSNIGWLGHAPRARVLGLHNGQKTSGKIKQLTSALVLIQGSFWLTIRSNSTRNSSLKHM
jgi:hypothetical protein